MQVAFQSREAASAFPQVSDGIPMSSITRGSNPIMAMYSRRKKQKVSLPEPAAAESSSSPICSSSDAMREVEYQQGGRSYSTHPTYPFPVADLPSGFFPAGIVYASAGKSIKKGDLDLLYFQPFVKAPTANKLYKHLLEELPWYKVVYMARGMTINTPRYTTVFGLDATAVFEPPPEIVKASSDGQSGVCSEHLQEACAHLPVAGSKILSAVTKQPLPPGLYQKSPRPIPRCLEDLKTFVEKATGETYNFVLCNFYADGTHSISPHSDDESFLGPNPCIASLSLGGTRDFVMKHKTKKDVSTEKFPLRSGDMIVMRGSTQANWLHSIPKRTGKTQTSMPRINVTFRKAMVVKGSNNYSHYNVGSGPVHRFVDDQMVEIPS